MKKAKYPYVGRVERGEIIWVKKKGLWDVVILGYPELVFPGLSNESARKVTKALMEYRK